VTGWPGALAPYLWVGLGGATGAVARYAVGAWLSARLGSAFPFHTLLVNVSGSLAIGILAGLLSGGAAPAWRLLLVVGFLGGYTTFSSFAVEVLALVQRGEWLAGVWYVVASNGLALAACYAGVVLAGVLSRTALPRTP
jgi:fluoride exporter